MNSKQVRRAAGLRSGLAAALAAVLLVWLTACGPGLGGTGTGASDDALAAFGAQPASVCQSDFADLLACTGSGVMTPAPTGASRWFAESEPASRVLLELAGNEAHLLLRCAALEFSGQWGVAAGQSPRFYGRISAPGIDANAMLLATRSADGLTLQLLDAAGQVLHGNLALKPVGAATGAAGC